MMKRVLLLLPLLIVQYALSGADEEIAASPSVPIITSTGANTPSKRVRLSSNVLQLMRQNSQEVQKEKIERKEKFAKKIEKFNVIFGEAIKKKQSQADCFFDMEMED